MIDKDTATIVGGIAALFLIPIVCFVLNTFGWVIALGVVIALN